MLKYFVKRFLAIIPKILVISMLIFWGMQLIPVDPLTISMDPEQLDGLSEAQMEELREAKGLNDPIPVQYVRWLGNLLQGEFGYSLQTGASIKSLILNRLPATFELAIFGVVIGSVLAIILGSFSAMSCTGMLRHTDRLYQHGPGSDRQLRAVLLLRHGLYCDLRH